jgi:hypothetical protein
VSSGLRIFAFHSSTVASSTFGWSVVVEDVLDRGLGGDPALGVQEPEENLWLEAPEASPAAKRPDRGHVGVAPEVLVLGRVGLQVLGTGNPGTGGAGVGTDEVGLARGDLGGLLLGLDVRRGPEVRLRDGHVQEVFPGLALELLELLLERPWDRLGLSAMFWMASAVCM